MISSVPFGLEGTFLQGPWALHHWTGGSVSQHQSARQRPGNAVENQWGLIYVCWICQSMSSWLCGHDQLDQNATIAAQPRLEYDLFAHCRGQSAPRAANEYSIGEARAEWPHSPDNGWWNHQDWPRCPVLQCADHWSVAGPGEKCAKIPSKSV